MNDMTSIMISDRKVTPSNILILYQTSRIVYWLHNVRACAHFHTPYLRYIPDTANVILLTDKLFRCVHQAIETCHDAKGC